MSEWSDDARRWCSWCGASLKVRARVHREDGPAVSLWKEGLGFLEVLAWYCPPCDKRE